MAMEEFRKKWSLIPWITAVTAVAVFALEIFGRAAAISATSAGADGAPVVLELFTSQGCSSCPPADALLSEIGSSTKGVIPLAEHVDYWNNLGWSDPFSSHEFSERQGAYANAMNLPGDYTPQAVIGGTAQCVGSDSRSISRAIDVARSTSILGRVDLHAGLSLDRPRTLLIRLEAQSWKGAGGTDEVMVAIFQNGLVQKIGAGENGGRKITYDYTVRRLIPALELDSEHGYAKKQLSVDLDPSWSLDHLGVAAFIQDTASLQIFAATSQYPISKK
jgi:hypothetical protein